MGEGEAAEAFLKAVLPTLKAGELDAGFSLHGPGANGLYAVVIGLKVRQGADLEKAVKDALQKIPEKDREKVKFDVDKAGGVNIHSAVTDDKGDEKHRQDGYGRRPNGLFRIPRRRHPAGAGRGRPGRPQGG